MKYALPIRPKVIGTLAVVVVLALIAIPPGSAEPQFTRINTPASDLSILERSPTIGEDFIAWESHARFMVPRINLRHVSSGRQEALSELPGTQLSPSAAGRELFWLQEDEPSKKYYVTRRVLATGEEARISDQSANTDAPLATSEWGWVAWVSPDSRKMIVDNINGDPEFTIAARNGSNKQDSIIADLSLERDLLVWAVSSGQGSSIHSKVLPEGEIKTLATYPFEVSMISTNGETVAWTIASADHSELHISATDHEVGENVMGFVKLSQPGKILGKPYIADGRIFWAWNDDGQSGITGRSIGSSVDVVIENTTQPISGLSVRRDLFAWARATPQAERDLAPNTDIIAVKLLGSGDDLADPYPSNQETISTDRPAVAAHLKPSTDGEWVVWQDNRYDSFGIFGRDLATDSEITIDARDDQDLSSPSVDWPLVTWAVGSPKSGLTIKNLVTGLYQSFPVTPDSTVRDPQISGSFLTWILSPFGKKAGQVFYSERSGPDLGDISEPTAISVDSSATSSDLYLYEDVVAWTEGEIQLDIRARILSSGADILVAATKNDEANPLVSETGIFWLDKSVSPGKDTVKLRRWDNTEITLGQVETVVSGNSIQLAGVSGDSLVYVNHDQSKYSLRAIDLTTRLETDLFESDKIIADPKVVDDILVWADRREDNFNVYAHSLTGQEIQRTKISSDVTRLEPIMFTDPRSATDNGPGCGR